MTPNDILQKIVEENGSCEFASRRPDICKLCPMSTLKYREDGNPLSCADALSIEGLDNEEANAVYKEAAGRLLAERAIEDIVERG